MIDIDELLELEAKAVGAPWGFPRYYNYLENTDTCLQVAVFAGLQGSRLSPEGELIVAMRNSFKPLLLELKSAREELKAARKIVEAARELAKFNDEYLKNNQSLMITKDMDETFESLYVAKIKKYLKELDTVVEAAKDKAILWNED